jgi:hypothetical protein
VGAAELVAGDDDPLLVEPVLVAGVDVEGEVLLAGSLALLLTLVFALLAETAAVLVLPRAGSSPSAICV